MNKIWTLYNMEFKRIYKLYFVLLGLLGLGNILATGYGLYDATVSLSYNNNLNFSISSIRSTIGINHIYNFTTRDIYIYGCLILGFSVLLCLIYAVGIWYRDYFSRNKTIYTLLALPQPKFNIYIAKFIMIVVMIYGVIALQFLMWFVDLSIVKAIAGINSPSFTNIFVNMMQRIEELSIVSPYVMEFLIIDVLAVVVTILVIFTGVMIERSFKKIGAIIGVLYVGLYVFGFVAMVFLAAINNSLVLIYHIGYFIVLTLVSLGLSYKLLNKRVHV